MTGLKKKIYFSNYNNQPNLINFQNKIHENFSKQLNLVKYKKLVLLFSGGKDSLLLFYYLIKHNINFECVFYDTKKKSVITKSLLFVKQICSENNIKLKIIKINLKLDNKFYDFFFNEMLFDYHYSFLHYSLFKKLSTHYKKNTVFISGQSADSILSFGPSAYTISNFIARFINLFYSNFISEIFCKILNYKFKNNSTRALNKNDFDIYFYNSFYYYSVKCDHNIELKNLSKKIIRNFNLNFFDFNSMKMYLKCHGFLQGPDNQVIIKTARNFNFNNILLPFANYQFIKHTLQLYNFRIDLLFPKFIIDHILVFKFNFSFLKILNKIFSKSKDEFITDLTKVNAKFKKKIIREILLKYEKKN